MLQLDPSERMTIPEIFNHVWVRVASSHHWMDNHLHQPTSFNHLSKDYHDLNNGSNNTVDFFSPFSAPARVSPFFATFDIFLILSLLCRPREATQTQ